MELTLQPLRLPSDNERPSVVISGPCSAETEAQVMTTANQLASKGCHIFRAGVWKPRTKPGGFEGQGEIAMPWLKRVKDETGMLVATEVATPEHVEIALKYGIDILWIGARTSANPFAIQALADSLRGVDIPVMVKNPVNPDLELWIGALERINQAGVKRLAAIHRGFSSYDKKIYRNLPMWQIPIELRRRIPSLPIICDPSHIGGRRELIAPLCQQAMDLGFDGLMVESHCDPDIRRLLRCLTHHAVVGLVTHKWHIAFSNTFHVHPLSISRISDTNPLFSSGQSSMGIKRMRLMPVAAFASGLKITSAQ